MTEKNPAGRNGADPGDIQVVVRIGQILGLFSTTRPSLRTADTAAELGLQRTTVHRYLASMVRARMLERQDDGSMTPGPLLVQVGALAIGGRKIMQIARPFLQRLAAETHQTTVLSLWGGQGPVIAMVEEDHTREVRLTASVGYALPMDSAQAAVFLAHLPDQAQVARLLDHFPEALRAQIKSNVARTRADGVAVYGSDLQGLRAVAAPVDDRDGICAALALLGTTAAIPPEPTSSLAVVLRAAARQLSDELRVAEHDGPEHDAAEPDAAEPAGEPGPRAKTSPAAERPSRRSGARP